MAIVLLLALNSVASAQLPHTVIKDLNGKNVYFDKLTNEGKPYIVTLWATWCKPCHRELTAINEYLPDWQDETGVKVIAVSVDEGQNAQRVAPLVNSKGWDFDVYLDPNGDLKRALGVNMVPFVMVVDGNGKIIYKHTGYSDGSEQELIEVVRKALK